MIMNALLCRCFHGEDLSRNSRNMPLEILRIRMKAIMTTSRAITTIDAGKSDVATVHVGAKDGRANPTSTPPATSRISKTPCIKNATSDTFAPSVSFHSSCQQLTILCHQDSISCVEMNLQIVRSSIGRVDLRRLERSGRLDIPKGFSGCVYISKCQDA